jgi:hypothetical protein
VEFRVAGIHPASWGGPTPPGAPIALSPSAAANGTNWSDLWERCYGVWPSIGGQGTYGAGCYGHDEPGIDPYSDLPGSGGNVTWNITLPIDRSPTKNQSNLYDAIWFGLTLSDPNSWLGQCFLELQFYPDSSWTSAGADNGNWVAAAVAWQIDPANQLSEDACFYQPLTVEHDPSAYFSMTQGDTVNVTLSGWVGDPYGENITVTDVSTMSVSRVTLYDSSTSTPLDPAFTTSSWSNSLLWTPGDETPVSFAFETGHSNPTFPNTNSYGGCSPGVPPPTADNPAVPCPSYDPGYWENDTLSPWLIRAPTFFNASARETASQIGFSQDLGALQFIDANSSGVSPWTCLGSETSAYCAYPWYSYSCSTHAYSFGATDYATTTEDFGKDAEYHVGGTTTNAAGLGFYPLSNSSVPRCSGPSAAVTIADQPATAGAVTILDQVFTGATSGGTLSAISLGNYSIEAAATSGEAFVDWTSTGAVTLADALAPYTTLEVRGAGTLVANFVAVSGATSSFANLTIASASAGANVTVVPGLVASGFAFGQSPGLVTVAGGATVRLPPGLYTVEADAPVGRVFGAWSARGDLAIGSPTSPVTFVDLAARTDATLNATFVRSSAVAQVEIAPFGLLGSIVLNGTSYSSLSLVSMPVGTYSLSAVPDPGQQFETWSYEGSMLTNFSESTSITLGPGLTAVIPVGFAVVNITLDDVGNGTIAWNTAGNVSSVAVANGTTVSQTVLGGGDPTFNLTANGVNGSTFTGWSTNDTAFADLATSAPGPVGTVTLNLTLGAPTVTLTANFASVANTSVTYNTTAGGSLSIGYASALTTAGVVPIPLSGTGVYVLAVPSAGYVVWGVGGTNLTTKVLQSSGANTRPWAPWLMYLSGASAGATFRAVFEPLSWPVTFAADAPGGVGATLNGTSLGVDDTLWLTNGTYSLSATLSVGTTFEGWTTSWQRLLVANPAVTSTSLTVDGPGTVYLLDAPSTVTPIVGASIEPSNPVVLPGGSLELSATLECAGNVTCPGGATVNWSLSAPTVGSLNATSGDAVTFTANATAASVTVSLNATWGGATVRASTSIEVAPALVSAGLVPASATIDSGQTLDLAVATHCTDALPCPTSGSFVWTDQTPSLGALVPLGANATYLSTATFQANVGITGIENLTVHIALGNVTLDALAQLTIVPPLLTTLGVAPAPGPVAAGTITDFSAVPGCAHGLQCPSGAVFGWSLAPSALGALNASSGESVAWTAGRVNASGWLNASASLNGQVVDASSVSLRVVAAAVALRGLIVTPSNASLAVGGAVVLTATLSCAPGPCPAAAEVSWAVAPGLGSLSALTGPSVTFTATAPGSASVYANATWNGTTVHSAVVPVTIAPSSTGSTPSVSPVYENPLLWVGLVLLAVAIVAVVLLARQRSPPETGPNS